MSENLVYADLNLTESTKPRLVKITDVQGSTYAEVEVQPLDTNAAASYASSGPGCHTDTINFKDSSRGKSCCSRKCVAASVAVIILLVLAVCLILMLTPGLILATETGKNSPQLPGGNYTEKHTGCPQSWKRNEAKCYYFSPMTEAADWNTSRTYCKVMNSDLVIIDNKKELDYLISQSKSYYYLLGLTYSSSEKKWRWINNAEHNSSMFEIKGGNYSDYLCTVIGQFEVQTAACDGSSTTKNMCEKAVNT